MPRLARVPASFFILENNDYLCTQIRNANDKGKIFNNTPDCPARL